MICKADECGKEFDPEKDWQLYCSKKCANRVRTLRYWKKRFGVGGENERL